MSRIAYLLTKSENNNRARWCTKLLSDIGFSVIIVTYIEHEDPVISNKLSMKHIYQMIVQHNISNEHSYIFEDDINIHEPIKLDEIVMYEKLSDMFFYLGICEDHGEKTVKDTRYSIYGRRILSISGNVRGLHAIGISAKGAEELLSLIDKSSHKYMDMILEDFSRIYPANIVRYDLQSNIHGHRGMFFQDRRKFPSTI